MRTVSPNRFSEPASKEEDPSSESSELVSEERGHGEGYVDADPASSDFPTEPSEGSLLEDAVSEPGNEENPDAAHQLLPPDYKNIR